MDPLSAIVWTMIRNVWRTRVQWLLVKWCYEIDDNDQYVERRRRRRKCSIIDRNWRRRRRRRWSEKKMTDQTIVDMLATTTMMAEIITTQTISTKNGIKNGAYNIYQHNCTNAVLSFFACVWLLLSLKTDCNITIRVCAWLINETIQTIETL